MFRFVATRALAPLLDFAEQWQNSATVEPRRVISPRLRGVRRGSKVLDDLDAVVWEGDPELPLSQQGIKILGVPVGRKEFCHTRARVTGNLSQKDLQRARLILLY